MAGVAAFMKAYLKVCKEIGLNLSIDENAALAFVNVIGRNGMLDSWPYLPLKHRHEMLMLKLICKYRLLILFWVLPGWGDVFFEVWGYNKKP